MKRYFLNHKRICLLYLLFIGLNATVPLIMAQAITYVTSYTLKGTPSLRYLIIILVVFSAYNFGVSWLYAKIKVNYRKALLVDIERDAYQQIVMQPNSAFHQQDPSQYSSFFLNDLKILEDNYLMAIPNFISGMFQMVFVGIYVVLIDWWILLYFVISSLLMMWIPKLLGKKIAESTEETTSFAGKLTAFLKETFSGFDTLAGVHAQKDYQEKTWKMFEQYEGKRKILNWFVMISDTLNASLGIIFQLLLLLLLAIGIVQGMISANYLVSVTSISATFMNGVFICSGAYSQLQSSKTIVAKIKKFQQMDRIEEAALDADCIDIQNLSYTINQHPILKDLSYCFKKGVKYLIIGESGSGKSTLFNILNGKIKNYSGTILPNEQLATITTTVTQKPASFPGNVLTNITLHRPMDPSQIKGMVQKVNLPLSILDKNMEEDSSSVSGGELQRIAIIRALMQPRPFILCDEITANLDKKSSEIIETTLSTLTDVGLLYISHHYTKETFQLFDVILELKEGRLQDRTAEYKNKKEEK